MSELDELKATLASLQAELDKTVSKLSQAPEKTVEDHKRLLKEYNDIKDIGQQLIGLIAENRQVPIGTLYANRGYGVGPQD